MCSLSNLVLILLLTTGYSRHQETKVHTGPAIVLDIRASLTLYQLVQKDQTSNVKPKKSIEVIMQTIKERMKPSKTTLDDRSSIYVKDWPHGVYSLFQPESGCPANAGVDWKTGYRTHTTHTDEGIKDDVSLSAHMKKPYMMEDGSSTLMRQHFCSVTTPSTGRPWPAGSYCINRIKDSNCPPGFKDGSILWDDRNLNNKNNYSGIIPASEHGSDTRMYYCCREDSSPQTPIQLPRQTPFYLYRYGGTCQEVAEMTVNSEYMRFSTACCNNERSDFTPDGLTEDDVMDLQLCYYQRK